MAKAKFFTEQVTGGSPGEASAEDMMRGYSDAGRSGMRDEGDMFETFFASEESGGFLGRPNGWER